jgi:RHS repeat-associated protein
MEYENEGSPGSNPDNSGTVQNQGFTYRYVYGLNRLSVKIFGINTTAGNIVDNGTIKLYLHNDRLGSTRYATSDVTDPYVTGGNKGNNSDPILAYTDYDEWGNQSQKQVLKIGDREIDVIKSYATYDYDPVLGLYYGKARMYSAADKRFMAVDPFKGLITNPLTLVQYPYVMDNPLRFIDPFGLDAQISIPKSIENIILTPGQSIYLDATVYGKVLDFVNDSYMYTSAQDESFVSMAKDQDRQILYTAICKLAGYGGYVDNVTLQDQLLPESSMTEVKLYNTSSFSKDLVQAINLYSLSHEMAVLGGATWQENHLALLSNLASDVNYTFYLYLLNEAIYDSAWGSGSGCPEEIATGQSAGRDIVGTNYDAIKPTQDIINPAKVAEYANKLRAGEKLAPIEAVEIPGKGIYIIEGHHRFVASVETGIPVEIEITQNQGPIGLPNWSTVQWKSYIGESQFWGD